MKMLLLFSYKLRDMNIWRPFAIYIRIVYVCPNVIRPSYNVDFLNNLRLFRLESLLEMKTATCDATILKIAPNPKSLKKLIG